MRATYEDVCKTPRWIGEAQMFTRDNSETQSSLGVRRSQKVHTYSDRKINVRTIQVVAARETRQGESKPDGDFAREAQQLSPSAQCPINQGVSRRNRLTRSVDRSQKRKSN